MKYPDPSIPARPAFTLIELLVVISIIALLIAILLPVLGSVRESARQSACSSNQRQLVIAVSSFASDNRDRLPSHYDPDGPVVPDTLGSPVLSYRIAAGPAANNVEYVGKGRLIEQGYISSPEVFYCPSQDAPFWQKSYFPDPFGKVGQAGLTGPDSGADGSTFLVRGNYMYNPAFDLGTNGFGPRPRLYTTLDNFDSKIGPDGQSEFPTQAPLFLDLLIGWGYDTNAHENQSVFLVAFIDGHVEPKKDSLVTRFYREQTNALETIDHQEFKAFLLTNLLVED
ncbi:MAG: DUF1559 domain-containing protein [Planctomycetota bacterium]